MRQISILLPGGFGVLRMVEAAPPTPSPGMAMINVEAAGVNFADCMARLGLYASSWRYAGWPLTPGFEVAGAGVGTRRGSRRPRDRKPVIALTRFGGYAEQVAVPRSQVFICPSGLTTPKPRALPSSSSRRPMRWTNLRRLGREVPCSSTPPRAASAGRCCSSLVCEA